MKEKKEKNWKIWLKRINDFEITDGHLKIAALIIFLLAALVMLGGLFIFGLRSG